jgi:hypothetical protein
MELGVQFHIFTTSQVIQPLNVRVKAKMYQRKIALYQTKLKKITRRLAIREARSPLKVAMLNKRYPGINFQKAADVMEAEAKKVEI